MLFGLLREIHEPLPIDREIEEIFVRFLGQLPMSEAVHGALDVNRSSDLGSRYEAGSSTSCVSFEDDIVTLYC